MDLIDKGGSFGGGNLEVTMKVDESICHCSSINAKCLTDGFQSIPRTKCFYQNYRLANTRRISSGEEPDKTKRQWQVMRLRATGLTQTQVAKRLHTTRENISIIEHRAHDNLRAAKATLAALEQLSESEELIILSGTSVFEATSTILLRGDVLGIKLNTSADSILAALRSKCKGKIRGHHLIAVAKIRIKEDGTVIVK